MVRAVIATIELGKLKNLKKEVLNWIFNQTQSYQSSYIILIIYHELEKVNTIRFEKNVILLSGWLENLPKKKNDKAMIIPFPDIFFKLRLVDFS